MAHLLNESVATTRQRIWGSIGNVATHFGVRSSEHFKSEHPVTEKGKVVGVTERLQFSDEEQRNTLLSIFQGVNMDGTAQVEAIDAEGGDMPYKLDITVRGTGAFPEKNAYAEMDKLTQAAVYIEPA